LFQNILEFSKKIVLIGYFFDKILELANKIQQIKNDFQVLFSPVKSQKTKLQ